jgi:hypothetical protein
VRAAEWDRALGSVMRDGRGGGRSCRCVPRERGGGTCAGSLSINKTVVYSTGLDCKLIYVELAQPASFIALMNICSLA